MFLCICYSGNKATNVHAEQLKKFEKLKLYSATMVRQVVSAIESNMMAKGELLQRVLDHI